MDVPEESPWKSVPGCRWIGCSTMMDGLSQGLCEITACEINMWPTKRDVNEWHRDT